MRLTILGLGLIGGSVAAALRARSTNDWSITAWTPSGRGPQQASGAGVVDRIAVSLEDAVRDAEVVLLAAPPLACLQLVDDLRALGSGALDADTVVTDVASTKRAIVDRARVASLRFVGGHPMAGREQSGFTAADAQLFVDRPWVICPDPQNDHANPSDVERVESLAHAVGARPLRLSAAEHDTAVAAISHLPLVVSAALAESMLDGNAAQTATALAATGWRDMTRLARGDASMAAGIVATNADEVARRLRDFRIAIDAWISAVEADAGVDAIELARRFERARRLSTDVMQRDDRDA